ncbi:MAG: prolipoprotein diacylglyceryl transferase family protein [Streptosporangiaceae bacterium]
MPVAYLPSPASAVWQLGPIPVRAYALCMVAGVVAGLWLTDRRYRGAGGQPGVILDLATVAVPVGLVGARLYSVLTNFGLYFGPGRDWTDVFRVWDGGLGIAGAVVAGGIAAWVYCRRSGREIGPIAVAAAPALAVAQAIAVWGNWFSQELYGSPSGLPWAVAISPQHRAAGLQSYATFQPVFLYQSLLDLLVAAVLSYAIRRYSLTGDRAFALYGVLYAAAGCIVETLRVDYSPRLLGIRTNMLAMLVILLVAGGYIVFDRQRRRARTATRQEVEPPVNVRALRPRSSKATAGTIGLEPGLPTASKPADSAPGDRS